MDLIELSFTDNIPTLTPTSQSIHVIKFMSQEKKWVQSLLKKHGIILMRNFPINTPNIFNQIVFDSFGFENTLAHLKRDLFKKLQHLAIRKIFNQTDYREITKDKTLHLGRPEASIQGPHIEAGFLNSRPQYIALYCHQTSPGAADTALYDMQKSYTALKSEERQDYDHALNTYVYLSDPEKKFSCTFLNWLFRLGLTKDGDRIKLQWPKTPMVCIHPDINKPCLQPFAFDHLTALNVFKAAKLSFPERQNIKTPDSTAFKGRGEWHLFNRQGDRIKWDDQQQIHFFKTIFDNAIIHTWQKNDIIIVDNMRFAHGRMEDNGGKERSIYQAMLNRVNINEIRSFK